MNETSEYKHLNDEILDCMESQELSEASQIVFEGESSVVTQKTGKRKRLTYAAIGMVILLSGGAIVKYLQMQPTQVELASVNDIDLVIAAAQKASTPPVVEIELPESSPIATQPVEQDVVEADTHEPPLALASLPSSIPQKQVTPPTINEPIEKEKEKPGAKNNVDVIPPELTLTLSSPITSAPQKQATSSVAKELAPKKKEPIKPILHDEIIVARNKQVQSLPMRNIGVVAVLTDGVILKKGDEDVEVALGEVMPGLGVLQKTSPKDRTIETDQRIYKLN